MKGFHLVGFAENTGVRSPLAGLDSREEILYVLLDNLPCMCVYVPYMCLVPMEAREGSGCLGTAVIGSCEPPVGAGITLYKSSLRS